ncbi:hypothetical protein V3565_05090 [Bartonella sp. B10]
MNTKSHIINQVTHDKPSSFVIERENMTSEPIEVAMHDIATKLRSIYAQMQVKQPPRHHSTLQRGMDNSLKSYLDDISRAILAEHYTRRQEKKQFFEHLEQIKMLVQSLHHKNNSLKDGNGAITHNISHLKSPASVIHNLAHAECEKSQNHSSHKKVSNFLKQDSSNTIKTRTMNVLQQDRESSSSTNVISSSLKEVEGLTVPSKTDDRCSAIRAPHDSIADSQCLFSSKTRFFEIISSLCYSVKKLFAYFLIIAFMVGATLCF